MRQRNAIYITGNAICDYITKDDKKPVVWGVDQILEAKTRTHKKFGTLSIKKAQVLEQLMHYHDWYQIYDNDALAAAALTSYSYQSIRSGYEDIQVVKDARRSLGERRVTYFLEKGNPLDRGTQINSS